MKSFLLTLISIFSAILLNAQSANLPVKQWAGKSENSLVFYISGDGGFNKFSTDLSTAISKAGYEVTALNAKSYFWDKRTPQQVASDIGKLITERLHVGKHHSVVLVGYSFGADVMPFIVNQLPVELKDKLKSVVLLSPSTTTDFQIRLMDMFGKSSKRSMDVVAAINQMHVPKAAFIFGSEENDFPANKIHLKNSKIVKLPGGHHFEGNTNEVASVIIANF